MIFFVLKMATTGALTLWWRLFAVVRIYQQPYVCRRISDLVRLGRTHAYTALRVRPDKSYTIIDFPPLFRSAPESYPPKPRVFRKRARAVTPSYPSNVCPVNEGTGYCVSSGIIEWPRSRYRYQRSAPVGRRGHIHASIPNAYIRVANSISIFIDTGRRNVTPSARRSS